MMTIREKVEQVTLKVANALEKAEGLSEEEKNEVVGAVAHMGLEWVRANANGVVACIMAGMSQRGSDEVFDPEDDKQLMELEAEGSAFLIRQIGLKMYDVMIRKFTKEEDPQEGDEEEDEGV